MALDVWGTVSGLRDRLGHFRDHHASNLVVGATRNVLPFKFTEVTAIRRNDVAMDLTDWVFVPPSTITFDTGSEPAANDVFVFEGYDGPDDAEMQRYLVDASNYARISLARIGAPELSADQLEVWTTLVEDLGAAIRKEDRLEQEGHGPKSRFDYVRYRVRAEKGIEAFLASEYPDLYIEPGMVGSNRPKFRVLGAY